MYRVFIFFGLIAICNAKAETLSSINQNATSVMLSKQSLLGMQLSMNNQYKKGKLTEATLKCVNTLGYESFFPIVDSIFNAELNPTERQQANEFYSGPAGKNIETYTTAQLYKHAGLEPKAQTILSNSDMDDYASFGQTNAGQKLLNQKVMESPSSYQKIGGRIVELLRSCNALPSNQ